MMRTLRGRLIVSHVLSLLFIVPIVGVALAYILETQVLLADFSHELAQHGACLRTWPVPGRRSGAMPPKPTSL